MNKDLEIRIQDRPWYSGFEFIIRKVEEYKTYQARLEFVETPANMIVESGTLSNVLSKKSAQLLMDDLWHCGLRPSDGTGSTGQLKATEKHLDDMRKIVQFNIGVEFKE